MKERNFVTDEELVRLLRLMLFYLAHRELNDAQRVTILAILRRIQDFIAVICQHELGEDAFRKQATDIAAIVLRYINALKSETRLVELLDIVEGKRSLKMMLFKMAKGLVTGSAAPSVPEGDILDVLRRFLDQERMRTLPPPIKILQGEGVCQIGDSLATQGSPDVLSLLPCAQRCDLLLLIRLEFAQEEIARELFGVDQSTISRAYKQCRIRNNKQKV
ncbi:MAG: hypothetical protein U1G07_09595 [Verrucomicrobiota bacterium]